MNSTKNLSKLLDKLVSDLNLSNKSKTAIFFNSLSVDLKEKTNISEVLDKILNSFSISQYANFTYKQDEIFDEIFDEAKKIKKCRDESSNETT